MRLYDPFGSQRGLERKKKYVEKTATPEAAVSVSHRFSQLKDFIDFRIGFESLYRLLMDIYLNFNLHLDYSQFEWNPINFLDFTTGLFQQGFEKIEKAKYGVSKYGEAIVDPEAVSPKNLERLAWELTYKATDRVTTSYKHRAKTLMDYLDTLREILVGRGLAQHYFENIGRVIAKVEGKVLNQSYWGFGIWDGTVWGEEDKYTMRLADDWLSLVDVETINAYECNWDMDSWDYARWVDEEGDGETIWTEEVEEFLDSKIKEFQDRTEPTWQGVFFLQKLDQLHMGGGYHQIRLSGLIRRAKAILYRRGVDAIRVAMYIAFLNELAYLYHESSRKYKQYRAMLTKDDVIRKYERMGLDREILEELANLIHL